MKRFQNQIIEHWIAFGKFVTGPSEKFYSFEQKWDIKILYLTTITSICLMVLGVVIQVVFSGFFQPEKNIIQNKDVFDLPAVLILIVGGILAPLFEELAFRLPLKLSLKNILAAIFSSVIIYVIFSKASLVLFYETQNFNITQQKMAIPCILFMVLLIFKIITHFERNAFVYGSFIWILSIVFAISHGFENIYSIQSFYFVLISTTTQFLAALYYSFLRLSFGIGLSVIVHSFWNILLLLLKFTFENNSI